SGSSPELGGVALRFEVPALVGDGGCLDLALRRNDDADVVRIDSVSEAGLHLLLSSAPVDATPLPGLPPELVPAFERWGSSRNGDGLARDLGRRPSLTEVWAHAPAYDTVIGCGRLEGGSFEHRAAVVLDTALWYAALSWMSLLGTHHIVR